MFFVFKKRRIVAVVAVFLVLFSGLSIAYGIGFQTVMHGVRTIVVDAGHGGRDSGVTGKVTGVRESDLNLKYAFALKEVLESKGFNVVMTRTTEDGLYDLATADSRQTKKAQDMQRRREIIEAASPVAVLSIHMNFFPNQSSVRGAQAFFNSQNPESKQLANAVQATLNKVNLDTMGRNLTPRPGDFFMVTCTGFPSIIVECGFLSNSEDEKLLITPEHMTRIVRQIAEGVEAFVAL